MMHVNLVLLQIYKFRHTRGFERGKILGIKLVYSFNFLLQENNRIFSKSKHHKISMLGIKLV